MLGLNSPAGPVGSKNPDESAVALRTVYHDNASRSLPYRGTSAVVTLDDVASRESATLDPRAFLSRPVDTLVIDEVQLVPALFRAIKAEVDRDRRPGRFLLTGSSRLLTAPDMADALVGRVQTLELWPFSQGEIGGGRERFVAGGFPEALRRSPARRREWLDAYVTTVTQSVIRDLAAIERLAELPRLLRLCAARTATELNVSALASDFGVPIRTTDGYLALLANAFLVHLLPAWSTNLNRPSLCHFRDRGGAEVDLVLEHPDGRIVALEVKATSTPRTSDLSGLRFLAERLGERFHFGVLLSTAPEATPFGPRMAALPVSAIWS